MTIWRLKLSSPYPQNKRTNKKNKKTNSPIQQNTHPNHFCPNWKSKHSEESLEMPRAAVALLQAGYYYFLNEQLYI